MQLYLKGSRNLYRVWSTSEGTVDFILPSYPVSGALGTSGAAKRNTLRVLAINAYNGDMATMRKTLVDLNRK
jgi:hypothetical protein